MRITWLGQAGLLFETDGKIILVDPYLSDSVAKVQPQNYRRIPVDERFLTVKPNVIVLTHDHLDHTDKETLCRYLGADSKVLVLAPYSAWKIVREFGGKNNNYVLFNAGTEWTDGKTVFRATYAEHSDEYAIGTVITSEGKNYYVTGDTLFSEKVFESLPDIPIHALFLPVNGTGNNMNYQDAKRFAERINAKYVVPVHFGMFDELDGKDLRVKGKVIPAVYKKIDLE